MQNNALKRSDNAGKAYKNYDLFPFLRQQCPLPFGRLGSKLDVYMITGVTLLLLAFPHHSIATENSKFEIVLDVSDRGKLGDLWLEAVEDRHKKEEYKRHERTLLLLPR